MQIDSSLSGNQYQGRIRDIDKGSADSAVTEQVQTIRNPGNLSFTDLLSSSLANTLWAVDSARSSANNDNISATNAGYTADVQMQFVQKAYLENGF